MHTRHTRQHMGARLDSLTASVHTRNSPHIPAHTLPPAQTLHRQVTSILTWVMYRVASTQLRAATPALTRLLTRPRVGPFAPRPAGTHTHPHTHTRMSHMFTGHTAAGTRVTARQRPHHSPPGTYEHRVTKPHPCAGTRRVVLHTWSQARAHGSAQFISPPKSRLNPSHTPTGPGQPAEGHGQVDTGREPGPPRSHAETKPPTTAALRSQSSGTTPNRPPMTASLAAGQPSANLLSKCYCRSQN